MTFWCVSPFGVIGYLFYKFEVPSAPLIVCLVLGSMAESNLRQALVASKGSYSFMYTHPIALAVLLLSAISFFVPVLSKMITSIRKSRSSELSASDLAAQSETEMDDD